MMWKRPWHIGLDIQPHQLYAVSVEWQRSRWWLRQWWSHVLPDGAFRAGTLLHPEAVSTILSIWRKTLPKKFCLQIALPSYSVMQQVVTIPPHIPTEEHHNYIAFCLPQCFPLPAAELASDYDVWEKSKNQWMVTVARRAELDTLLNALGNAGLTPAAVDLNPYVLRQMARLYQINHCVLFIHLHGAQALVVSPLKAPPYFILLTLHTPFELIISACQWCKTTCRIEPQQIMLCGEIPDTLTSSTTTPPHRIWSPLTQFQHHGLTLPTQPALFTLACGLALRTIEKNGTG